MSSTIFRSIKMLHFLKKSLQSLGLDVVDCITSVYFIYEERTD